ncbi:hypothetical protein [Spirosoma foliorum]|uniref:DUF3037 domain-containing protein n=1 Tax=Spirosoma foliorum TaxID=2710596 RepID=A0A7G5GT71_9BACT|nr:hypothetical protein [Spirosoma foliorum]QMW02063.1 hypothetical protein H3H32_29685 [Spirosoma foliorum]
MNTFITPLFVQTNPLSLEKIVFGLLGVSEQAVYFHTSDHKLSVAEQLLGKPVAQFIKNSLSSLRETVKQHNKAFKQEIFGKALSAFNASYINTLSQYSNGLLQFGEPMPLAGGLSRTQFVDLYEKFVGEPYNPAASGRGAFARLVKKTLDVPGLDQKADIYYPLKPGKIKGLLKPTNVTLLTTHGVLIVYQQIDFTNTEAVVANNLYEYEAVADVLNSYSKANFNRPGQFKIVAETPPILAPQHKQFETIKEIKKSIFSVITPQQLAEEARLIASNGHVKASVILEEEK